MEKFYKNVMLNSMLCGQTKVKNWKPSFVKFSHILDM